MSLDCPTSFVTPISSIDLIDNQTKTVLHAVSKFVEIFNGTQYTVRAQSTNFKV